MSWLIVILHTPQKIAVSVIDAVAAKKAGQVVATCPARVVVKCPVEISFQVWASGWRWFLAEVQDHLRSLQ